MASAKTPTHPKRETSKKHSKLNEQLDVKSMETKAGKSTPSPMPTTPPPPYTSVPRRLPPNVPQQGDRNDVGRASQPVNCGTRYYYCHTDDSCLVMNADGSQIYYSKGKGRAVSTPTGGSTERKYFCTDTSFITLSGEGWIEYNGGPGNTRTISGPALNWHRYTNREGYYANVPSSATTITVQSPNRGRSDSACAIPTNPRGKTGRNVGALEEEDESDGYDEWYKFGNTA